MKNVWECTHLLVGSCPKWQLSGVAVVLVALGGCPMQVIKKC